MCGLVTVDDSADYPIGCIVMVETGPGAYSYEVGTVTGAPDGTHITITPDLSFAPGDTASVTKIRTYQEIG